MKNIRTFALAIFAACFAFAAYSKVVSTNIVNCTDNPFVLDTKGASLSWKTDDGAGFTIDCYCKIAPQTPTSNYTVLQRCRMTFGADGRLISAELLPDRIRIKASSDNPKPPINRTPATKPRQVQTSALRHSGK